MQIFSLSVVESSLMKECLAFSQIESRNPGRKSKIHSSSRFLGIVGKSLSRLDYLALLLGRFESFSLFFPMLHDSFSGRFGRGKVAHGLKVADVLLKARTNLLHRHCSKSWCSTLGEHFAESWGSPPLQLFSLFFVGSGLINAVQAIRSRSSFLLRIRNQPRLSPGR